MIVDRNLKNETYFNTTAYCNLCLSTLFRELFIKFHPRASRMEERKGSSYSAFSLTRTFRYLNSVLVSLQMSLFRTAHRRIINEGFGDVASTNAFYKNLKEVYSAVGHFLGYLF